MLLLALLWLVPACQPHYLPAVRLQCRHTHLSAVNSDPNTPVTQITGCCNEGGNQLLILERHNSQFLQLGFAQVFSKACLFPAALPCAWYQACRHSCFNVLACAVLARNVPGLPVSAIMSGS